MTRTSLADLQRAAEAGARAATALLPPRPTDRGAVQAFGTRMTSYLRRRKSRRAATPAPEPTSQLTRMLLEYEALTANAPPPRKALAEALYDVSSEYTRAQSREVARTVREGYDNDKGVEKVAAELKRRLGLEGAQANVLAQTEMTRVAALDQLDQTARAGLDEVMFISHENACPQCEALHGKIFPLKRAHEVIPVHPGCKCRFQPVGSTHNVFCPTGEGGGIDPTCSPGKGSGAKVLSKTKDIVEMMADKFGEQHGWEEGFTREGFIKNWTKTLRGTKADPEAVKDIEGVIERVYSTYDVPRVPVVVRKPTKEETSIGENAHWDNGFIVVMDDAQNERKFRSEVKALGSKKVTVKEAYPDVLEGLIVHELGHKYHTDAGSNLDNPLLMNARRLIGDPAGRKIVAEKISDYASTHYQELIAEAYAMSKHPDYNSLPVDTRDLVEDALGRKLP